MNPALAVDEIADYARDHARRSDPVEMIPVGEVIELPEQVAWRMWHEAKEGEK